MKKLLLTLGIFLSFSLGAMAQTASKVTSIDPTIDPATVINYDINMDFEIKEISVGPCFAAKDGNNFFMWQINIETGKTIFRPHSWLNGGGACHAEIDITDIIDVQKAVVYALRIEIRGDKATTYINDILVDKDRVNPRGGNYGFANLGFRQDKGMLSETLEEAYFDNITVTTIAENPVILFEENFSNPLDFQFGAGSVVEGRFFAIGRTIYWQIPPTLYADYILQMDFEITNLAAGPCFAARDAANFYMWQLNIEEGGSRFRPHSWLNNAGVCHEEKDISDLIVLQKDVTYTLRIEIKGEKASTYINDILIDADRVNPRGGRVYGYAKLGFRQSHDPANVGEKAYFDNILITTTVDGGAATLFSENFSSMENSFTAGELVNERLYVASPGNDLYAWQKELADVATAVQALEAKTAFAISPNPVQSQLNVAANPVAYHIYNMIGKQIQSGIASTIDVANLESGVYMIRMGNKTTKFVKN